MLMLGRLPFRNMFQPSAGVDILMWSYGARHIGRQETGHKQKQYKEPEYALFYERAFRVMSRVRTRKSDGQWPIVSGNQTMLPVMLI